VAQNPRIHHRFTLLATYNAPHGMVIAPPLLSAQSGTPYNLTIGNNLTGNNQFNARPTFGTCGAADVVSTPYGCLDTKFDPVSGRRTGISDSFCGILYSLVNSAKQIIGIKRLVKEINSAFGEYSLSDLFVPMAGNKDNGQFRVLAFDATLQLETVHSWHPHVGDEAARFGQDSGLQSFFG
jgi:hypothetical protein